MDLGDHMFKQNHMDQNYWAILLQCPKVLDPLSMFFSQTSGYCTWGIHQNAIMLKAWKTINYWRLYSCAIVGFFISKKHGKIPEMSFWLRSSLTHLNPWKEIKPGGWDHRKKISPSHWLWNFNVCYGSILTHQICSFKRWRQLCNPASREPNLGKKMAFYVYYWDLFKGFLDGVQ